MKFLKTFFLAINLLFLVLACESGRDASPDLCQLVEEDVEVASSQLGYQVALFKESGTMLNPKTVYKNKIEYIPEDNWASGFFPGSMWYMYELTKKDSWKKLGGKYLEELDSVKFYNHHDIGLIVGCSFGNAYRLTQNPAYKEVIIEAARTLITRYRPAAGVIQAWDENRGWQSAYGWMCPVTIDAMMNLELLFGASKLARDSTFRHIAVQHADATMKNHYREDNSCYHVVDYDKLVGGVRRKTTSQGFSTESSWARGQAWGLYGFTVCYRETKDPRYLKMAEKIVDYLFSHKNMPADLVPYWDFDAPDIPHEPRDASAAAIIASALYDLSIYKPVYRKTADKILETLSGPSYRAIVGTNGNFILMHSVGSVPHSAEIDVPLNYADYYFLEALQRKKNLDCR